MPRFKQDAAELLGTELVYWANQEMQAIGLQKVLVHATLGPMKHFHWEISSVGIRSLLLFTEGFNDMAQCYGFAWQGFGSRGAIGVASVRSCQKLPPCTMEPVPAGSKTDPPLAKAKPVSDGGSSSVITYLRKGRKKLGGQMAGRRELVRRYESKNSADTKVSEEGGGGGARDAGAQSVLLLLVMKTW